MRKRLILPFFAIACSGVIMSTVVSAQSKETVTVVNQRKAIAPSDDGHAQAPEVDAPQDASPVQLGSSGESCTRSRDCANGLKCISQVCIDPSLGRDGDSCTKTGDCNGHLRCIDRVCRGPASAKASPGGSATDTVTSAPQPSPTPPAPGAESAIDRALEPYRGLGVAYGIGVLADLQGGNGPALASSLIASYRFSRLLGLGAMGLFGHSENGGAMGSVGLHIGRRFYGEPGLAVIRAESQSKYDSQGQLIAGNRMETGVGLGGGIGAFIRLNDYLSIAPRGLFAAGTNGSILVFATLGVGVYVARKDD